MTLTAAKPRQARTIDSPVEYLVLPGPQFEDALSGRRAGPGVDGCPRWLESPTLKYYHRRSCLIMGADQRTLFVAVSSVPPSKRVPQPLKRCVGILELEVSPYDDREVWLKYITVDPARQREGIAKEMLRLMVEHLKLHPRMLARSRPSDEGKQKIQAYISQLLEAHGLPWKQGE